MELSVTRLGYQVVERIEAQLPQFHVFDGSSRIVIEAQSEEDVFYLCNEMGWELICAYEG